MYYDFFEAAYSMPDGPVDCSRAEQRCWKLDDVDACEVQYTRVEKDIVSIDLVQSSLHP